VVPERRRRDHARRIVDRADQGQPGTPTLEPVVPAAVDLEEQTLGRHPFTPAAVARWAPSARAGQPGRAQDPLEARPADLDALALGEQLGEVAVVDVGVRRPAKLDDLLPERGVEAPLRRSAAVAMDEPGRTVPLEGDPQPPQLTLREPQRRGRLGHRQLALQGPCQDPCPALFPRGHRDRRLHSWRLTNSLSS
jgi:hypothetical protein